MNRKGQQRVDDILQSIDRCHRYLDALDSGDQDLVDMAEDAIDRNLQIIGEAVTRLPAEMTEAHPEINWPQICSFRNILVHQYFGVDHEIVRDVVETHLPTLATALRDHADS